MLSYSIAIRTLGTSGESFKKELESISRQTVQPDKVMVYIAEGYERPDFQIGKEEFVWVKKGMVAQRALPYDEIESEVILFLDDDVELAPDSAEKLISALEQNDVDAIGTDVFRTYRLPLIEKIHYMISNLTFPVYSGKWAFKLRNDGSFSYNVKPRKEFYLTQKFDGGASMIKKIVFRRIHLEDELWLDDLGFPYGEDTVLSYKLFRNGFKVGYLFNSGFNHLDGGTSSRAYRAHKNRIYIRTKASYITWRRLFYNETNPGSLKRMKTLTAFSFKFIWLAVIMSLISVFSFNLSPIRQYLDAIRDGRRFVNSEKFKSLGSFFQPFSE